MQNDLSKSRHNAVNCRPVTNRDDWSLILTYLTKSSDIIIEKIVKGKSRHGNPYTRKENTAISLKKAAARQLFAKKSIEETKDYIIDYFKKELNKSDFVPYCEFLEDRVNKCISTENRTVLLSDIFNYFGKNLSDEALFYTWKSKKFNYISWASNTDHVIPEDVLKKFSLHIHQPELQRIYTYPFGPSFCHSFVVTKLENLQSYTSEETKSLHPLLTFLEEGVRDTLKKDIDLKYSEKYSQEIIEKAKKFGRIEREADFNNYKWLKNNLPDNLEDEYKLELKKTIDDIIISNSSEKYKVDLWLKDIVKEVSFEMIEERFSNDEIDVQTKILILQKLPLLNQLSVLKGLSKQKGFEASFAVLEGLLKKENSLSYYQGLKEKMFEEGVWKEKKSGELLISFSNYVQQVASAEEKYSLFFKGLIKDIPQNVALTNALSFSYEESRKVLKSLQYDAAFTLEFLNIKVDSKTISETAWIYDLAREFLEASAFKEFDEKVFSTITSNLYFELWEKGKAKILPAEYLRSYLNSNSEHYTPVKKWIEKELVAKEEICSFLFEILINQDEIVDRKGLRYDNFQVNSQSNSFDKTVLNITDYLEQIRFPKRKKIDLDLFRHYYIQEA